MRQKGDLLGPPPVVTTCRSGLAVRTGLASLAGPFLVKHHGRFLNDGRGGPARIQRVVARVGLISCANAGTCTATIAGSVHNPTVATVRYQDKPRHTQRPRTRKSVSIEQRV